MTAIALAFSKVVPNRKTSVDSSSKVVFLFLLSISFLGLLFYMFFIGKAVFSVVERHDLEFQTKALRTNVADLEASYMASQKSIDISMAHAAGFEEATSVVLEMSKPNSATKAVSLANAR